MKKLAGLILGLMLSHNVFALDSAVENIQALCGLAKEGKQSEIQGKIQLQADGSVKLATIGGKGEMSFSKGEWAGLQQILWAKQPDSAKTYADCVKNALPYFKSKPVTPAAAPKPAAKKTSSAPAKAKSTATAKPTTPPPAATPAPATTPDSEGDTNTQTIGSQSAEKIINATEINGNIDMGK